MGEVGVHLNADYVLSGAYGNGDKRLKLDVSLGNEIGADPLGREPRMTPLPYSAESKS